MKSSLVPVYALVYYLVKNELNAEEHWLVVDKMTETLLISTGKIQLEKMKEF